MEYTGMVELRYKTDDGFPLMKGVMAFHNTAKELKADWLPGLKKGDYFRVVKVRR